MTPRHQQQGSTIVGLSPSSGPSQFGAVSIQQPPVPTSLQDPNPSLFDSNLPHNEAPPCKRARLRRPTATSNDNGASTDNSSVVIAMLGLGSSVQSASSASIPVRQSMPKAEMESVLAVTYDSLRVMRKEDMLNIFRARTDNKTQYGVIKTQYGVIQKKTGITTKEMNINHQKHFQSLKNLSDEQWLSIIWVYKRADIQKVRPSLNGTSFFVI